LFQKESQEKLFFLSKTQSCFHIYSIKTISNGLHILKEVIRRGLFLKTKISAFDLKLPRTLIKVSMQWFIYIQKKRRVTKSNSHVDKEFFFHNYEHFFKIVGCMGVIRSNSYIGIWELYE
jgi:hypothetical protein